MIAPVTLVHNQKRADLVILAVADCVANGYNQPDSDIAKMIRRSAKKVYFD